MKEGNGSSAVRREEEGEVGGALDLGHEGEAMEEIGGRGQR